MDPISIAIFIIILLFSVIFHEVSHGLMAYRLGDPTAKYAGRLTLNPIPHIDVLGSILLPAFLAYFHLPVLGAAKPVPVNYNNLRDIRSGMFLVSLAGPLANFALAIVAAAVFRLSPGISGLGQNLLIETIYLNLTLGVFNLIPVPPLDGSKILASILGYINHNWMFALLELERFGFIFVFAMLFLIPGLLNSVLLKPVTYLLQFLIGQSLPVMF